MAMLIKGAEIDALVSRYCAMTGQTNKSEAVREALAAQIKALAGREGLTDRVARLQERAAADGFLAVSDDDKTFMDEMWGET